MARPAPAVTPPASPNANVPAAVRVRDLTVAFATASGERPAVSHVSLDLPPGQITGLLGESGSGKSTLALALLNATPGRVTSGSVEIDGVGDVFALPAAELRRVRGAEIGYVFQASQNSLNPLKPVGKQLLDLGRSHGERDLRGLLRRARGLLEDVGLDSARVLSCYQHELSGGMRQRVGIVFALVLNAHVLILDEPTTALDMLSQAWSASSPTAPRSCTPGASSRRDRPGPCWSARGTPTPAPCSPRCPGSPGTRSWRGR